MVPPKCTIVARKRRRHAAIARHSYRVIQFWKDEVLENVGEVHHLVFAALRPPHLTPALSAPNGAEREMVLAVGHE